jgi:peptidoglycan/LPS O-acetylase OafA/YrhL
MHRPPRHIQSTFGIKARPIMQTKSANLPHPWIRQGRVPHLDGLRGFAILLVLFSHGAQTHGFPNLGAFRPVIRFSLGVDTFFVISGFLITLLLLRELSKSSTLNIYHFYWRRLVRLAPGYVAYLCVILSMSYLGVLHVSNRDWTAVLTYTVNFVHRPAWVVGHLWSLSIQEQFYLAWPPLLLVLRPEKARKALVAYLVAAPLLRLGIWIFHRESLPMVSLWTPTRLDSIAVGCVLALYVFDERYAALFSFSPTNTARVCMFATVLLIASCALGERSTFYAIVLGFTTKAMCIATLVWLGMSSAPGVFSRITDSWLLRTIGAMSYSVYLWQQLFMDHNSYAPACRWPLNLIFLTCTAGVSYMLVERPIALQKANARTMPGSPVRRAQGPAHGPSQSAALCDTRLNRETVVHGGDK